MVCGWDNILLATTVFFMIPLIVLSSLILSTKIKTENLEKIIDTPQSQSDCYLFTYYFVKEQNTDERYISLNTYLKSLTPLWIVIIVFYSLKIILSFIFTRLLIQEMVEANTLYICFFYIPARIITFIPIIVCVILLRIRGYTTKCEVFMNFYEQCSKYYGESFIDNFKDIMRINTLTLCVVILFLWEVVYHGIIFSVILCKWLY